MATRTTRSRSRQQSSTRQPKDTGHWTESRLVLKDSSLRRPAESISGNPTPDNTGLDVDRCDLLLLKQRKLRDPNGQVPGFIQSLRSGQDGVARAAAATLVFAQHEAGTAVSISPDGLLLTCSHCIAETKAETKRKEDKWLLFASGQVVRAQCVAWDERRDLALLQIVAAQSSHPTNTTGSSFPFASIGTSQGGQLLCIGHPGSEDLEASTSGIETDYDVLHISSGRFRGLAADQDPQDNSEIGALMHDCWTYWGHSGASLIARSSGKVVGLHSSWDDETGMRRGVPLVAIRAFLDEWTVVVVED